jgi:hypothetical protein
MWGERSSSSSISSAVRTIKHLPAGLLFYDALVMTMMLQLVLLSYLGNTQSPSQ